MLHPRLCCLHSLSSSRSQRSLSRAFIKCHQMKSMMESGRWIATIIYLLAIAGTLAVAFSVGGLLGVILVIILLIIQLAAMIW